MGIWRMDRKTAIYIAEHIFDMPEHFPLHHCDKCDSDYLENIGHEHGDYIDFETETHDIPEEDIEDGISCSIGKPKRMTPRFDQEREAIWDNMFDVLKGD